MAAQGSHTCAAATTRDTSIATLDDCKAHCDATPGCQFILWSYNYAGTPLCDHSWIKQAPECLGYSLTDRV